ncbi:MAG: hypothetical protein ACI4OI_02620 [Gemmiger sp.]
MAWVTKSSTEQYQPEPEQQYTKKQKAANWWHYHWKYLAVGAAAVVLVGAIIKDTVLRTRPDYQVAYVGRMDLPVDTYEALQTALTAFGQDLNGDGQVVVQLNRYTVDFNSDDSTDAYGQMAGVTQLSADLASGKGSYVFLLEDAEAFQHETGALQYLDGTVGDPDIPPTDWQNMVYQWKDCPVLTALDLGDYTGRTVMDEETGSSQALLADVYVARRGVWDPKQADNFTGCADLWAALTAGAVPLEAAP